MSIKRNIRNILAKRLGVPEIPTALHSLAARGYTPELIVDVGAYRGDFARLVLGIWPSASVVCCEPLPQQLKMLQKIAENDSRISIVNRIVGAQEQHDVVLHCAETASSVLEEQCVQAFPEIHCPMTTLDLLFECTFSDQAADLIKIDVQGYELEVLRGAEKCLQGSSALLIECNLLDIHKNVPLMHEVVGWLAEREWRVYDIAGLTRRPLDGALWQADFIFVPNDSPLRADKRWGV